MWGPGAHIPGGFLSSGARIRAACSCGWTSTPRVDEAHAKLALESEHGLSAPLCALCGRDRGREGVAMADRYRDLVVVSADHDDASETFLVCRNERVICHDLTAQAQVHLDRAAFESLGMSAPGPRLRVIPGGQPKRSDLHLVSDDEEIT